MTEIEISPAAAEGYLAAVAEALAEAGFALPEAPAAPYTADPDEFLGGTITLPTALPDDDALGLVWSETEGWFAGYPDPEGGIGCLTELWLDIAPPPWRVVRAVQAIARTGDLKAGTDEGGRAVWPAELLPLYEPDAAGLVQVGADALKAHAARLTGRPARPADEGGVVYEHVRPIVAAVWGRARGRVTELRDRVTELETLADASAVRLSRRVRAVTSSMHEPSAVKPDACRPACPGCRVEAVLLDHEEPEGQ